MSVVNGESGGYAHELAEMRKVLDTAPVVGLPRKEAELAELARLVEKFPDEAEVYLTRRRRA